MGLETSTYIDGLDQTWPTGLDPVNKGDDHIRLLKAILKATFPGEAGNGFDKAILANENELNFVQGVTANIQTQLNAIVNNAALIAVPVGAIVMFNGAFASIPSNFQLCDGTNGTPNMTDKFVYGTNEESELKDTGGSADAIVVSHTHTTVSAGSHQHGAAGGHTHTAVTAGSHQHAEAGDHQHPAAGVHSHATDVQSVVFGSWGGTGRGGTLVGGEAGVSGTSGTHQHANAGAHQHAANGDHTHTINSVGNHFHSATGSHTHTINSTGGSGAGANIPPYVKLAFIQRMS